MTSRQIQGNFFPIDPKLAPLIHSEKKENWSVLQAQKQELPGNFIHYHSPYPPPYTPAPWWVAAGIFVRALGCAQALSRHQRLHARPFGVQDWVQLPTAVPSCCPLEACSPEVSMAEAVGRSEF